MSKVIPLEKLYNTRDLGGMPAAGGRRIREGRLIRSGHLYPASVSDIVSLSGRIGLVVDFRNRQEAAEKPDPPLPGADYVHLPIIQEMVTGVTREEKSFDQVMQEMLHDPQAALLYMQQVYTTFVTNEFARSQYAQFIDLLLQEREGAVLWHCTAGKDRAGFASILVQTLLGVDREAILEDYLQTNICLKPEVDPLIEMIIQRAGEDTPAVRETLDILFSARTEYLKALYTEIDKSYGSFDAYAGEGLGISPEKRRRLQEIYLT